MRKARRHNKTTAAAAAAVAAAGTRPASMPQSRSALRAGKKVEERVGLHTLRPMPPPSPAGFLDGAAAGMPLELEYLDGWWDVVLTKARSEPARKYEVGLV